MNKLKIGVGLIAFIFLLSCLSSEEPIKENPDLMTHDEKMQLKEQMTEEEKLAEEKTVAQKKRMVTELADSQEKAHTKSVISKHNKLTASVNYGWDDIVERTSNLRYYSNKGDWYVAKNIGTYTEKINDLVFYSGIYFVHAKQLADYEQANKNILTTAQNNNTDNIVGYLQALRVHLLDIDNLYGTNSLKTVQYINWVLIEHDFPILAVD